MSEGGVPPTPNNTPIRAFPTRFSSNMSPPVQEIPNRPLRRKGNMSVAQIDDTIAAFDNDLKQTHYRLQTIELLTLRIERSAAMLNEIKAAAELAFRLREAQKVMDGKENFGAVTRRRSKEMLEAEEARKIEDKVVVDVKEVGAEYNEVHRVKMEHIACEIKQVSTEITTMEGIIHSSDAKSMEKLAQTIVEELGGNPFSVIA